VRLARQLLAWSLTTLVVGAWLGVAQAAPTTPEYPSVLILAGQPGSPAAAAVHSGVRTVLQSEWSFRVSIDVAHVDVARYASPEAEERRLRAMSGSKHGNQRFDMIVAAFPDAFRFILRTRDELWPGTPVVVCGVDERSVGDLKPLPGFAILTIRFDMEGTLRAARTLLPDTRHVALVGGAGPVEQPYHDMIRQAVSKAGGLDVIDLTRLPIADVLTRVSSLPEHTVIVLSGYQVDGAGRRFYGTDVVPHVSNAANRPAFTQVTLALGQGAVGGSVIDFEDIGRDAGRMAVRMLRGEAAPSAPVSSSATSVLRFDGRQLARWNLDERRLPEDSQVLFRQATLWREYRWHVVSAVALIVVQAALIVTMLVQRRRRREAQAALTERLRFEMLVSEIVVACETATLDQLDERIREGLRRVGMFLGVDRGTLWQRTQESSLLTHAWERSGAAAPRVIFEFQRFPYLRTRMEAGDVVCFTSPDDLPPEAASERAAAKTMGVRSYVAIPLRAGDRLLGVLVFLSLYAERQWSVHIVQQLRTLAEPFATALIRIQSAAAVESSAAMAGAVLAALPGETAIIDAAGTIVQTNEAWATAARSGADAQLALKVGANYLEACRNAVDMPPDVARNVYASIESILRGERDECAAEYPTSRRGEDRWLEVRVRRLAHFGGGAAVMHFDVTARRQAEATARRHLSQIAHLDRVAAVGQLASSMAHELNQPLTGSLANAQALKRWLTDGQPDLEKVQACLADIVSDNKRASEVIRRMRRLLKKTDFVIVPLELNDLAANTIRLVANDARLNAVTIDFLPAPALPIAYGDTVQIQQVILNLLTNAITAAANGGDPTGRVTVWTSVATAPYVELGVRDSGKGIAETDLDRIFEPFFTTKPEGLGIGLTISRTIVDAHGGRLFVENDPAGGAIFRVHLHTDQSRTT
jgi:signal transduction histidine kinase/ABC-type uncharacterized transport system substrate-binding protein